MLIRILIYPHALIIMHDRKSIRAKWYNYTSPWAYFVTICTKNRKHYFGEIQNHTMILNVLGEYCTHHRTKISYHYPNVFCDTFICMPNHVHWILIIGESVGTQFFASWNHTICKSGSLGAIIRWFKIWITKFANDNWIVFARQNRYHDHIIRNSWEYERIKYYIQNNPANRNNDWLQ